MAERLCRKPGCKDPLPPERHRYCSRVCADWVSARRAGKGFWADPRELGPARPLLVTPRDVAARQARLERALLDGTQRTALTERFGEEEVAAAEKRLGRAAYGGHGALPLGLPV